MMQVTLSPRQRVFERFCWIAALGVVVCGYGIVTRHFERKIGSLTSVSLALSSETAGNQTRIAQGPKIRRLKRQLLASLRGVVFAGRQSNVDSLLLRDLEALGVKEAVQLLGVAPSSEKSPPAANTLFEEVPLNIALRGRFVQLLHFVQELPHQSVLVKIDRAQFELAKSRTNDYNAPLVEGKLRVIVYHASKSEGLQEW
ncbi:MAG: hypothetical protein NVS9B12_09020 [Vulcanimicrobiaceae bacterium]